MSRRPRRQRTAPIREAEAPVSGPVAQEAPTRAAVPQRGAAPDPGTASNTPSQDPKRLPLLREGEADSDLVVDGRWLDVAQRWLLVGAR